jgi:hypothetical protein
VTSKTGLQRAWRAAGRILLLVGIAVPVVAWAMIKPVRVVVPSVAPVTCSDTVCADVPERLGEARELAAQAQFFVEGKLGPLAKKPTVVFCATQACADYFGLGRRSAVTMGTWGSVIGPRAWKPYYVRHELIHQEQALHLGVLPLLWTPDWIREGMAYGLSDDPRAPLAEPFESQRNQFMTWYAGHVGGDVWAELRKP